MTGRALAVCLAVAGGGLVTACDSSAGGVPATPAATAAIAGPSAVDPCLVGTWRSSSIKGSFTVGSARINIRGGAGEVLTINAGGAIRTDDSRTAPVAGNAPDGTQYLLVQSGMATGTIASTAGRIKVNLDQPTSLTVAFYKNGKVIQRQHPGSANDTYACAAGSSLVITGGGGTVTVYAPG